MRGFPSLQSILVVLAIMVAGVPVYRLTRPAPAVASSVSAPSPSVGGDPGASAPGAMLTVEAVFAPSPVDFQIRSLDQTVLAGRGPQARFMTHWAANVPTDGADLVVQAHWPKSVGADSAAGLAAARLTVRFPDGRTVEKSFWSDASGALADVLTLPVSTSPPDAP